MAIVLAIAVFALAAALAVAFSMLLKANRSEAAAVAEKSACERTIVQLKEEAARREAEFEARLAEKGEELRVRLAEKGEELRVRLAEAKAEREEELKKRDEAVERLLAEKSATFAKSVETLKEQFSTLAAEKMQAQGANLSLLAKERLESVFNPFKDQVKSLQESIVAAKADRANLQKSFDEKIGALDTIAGEMAKTAAALYSDTRFQGQAGERILEEKLLQAGLEKGVQFFLQQSHSAAEGGDAGAQSRAGRERSQGVEVSRPDAEVCDAQGRWFVIDSKVSLTAYIQMLDAKTEAEYAERQKAHVESVRRKIRELAVKRYHAVAAKAHPERTYMPVTVMFVPYEAPLAAALRADASLLQEARDGDVVLATPLTLLAFMRLVFMAWQTERQIKNQSEILAAAEELAERINGYIAAFEQLGKKVGEMQNAYDKAGRAIVNRPNGHTISRSLAKLLRLHVKLAGKKSQEAERLVGLVQEVEAGPAPEGDGEAADAAEGAEAPV